MQALRKAAKRDVLIFCCDYVQQEQVYEMLSYNDVNGLIPRPFFLSDLCRTARLVRSGAAANGTNSASILNGMRFLCAEDHQQNAEILAATLESNGAACIMCPDGEQLLKAFAEAKPGDYDAILMDVQLPKISGLEASRAIQSEENPLGQTIPIIAITANAFTGDIQQCLDAGMDAHVLKPLETSALERAVRCVVGKEFFNVD